MELGMVVKEQVMDGSEGRLVRKGKNGIIAINKNIPEQGRKRFAIAHEIGHFELHSDSQLELCSDQDMLGWKDNNLQELEANEFASNLLMPEALFIPLLKKKKKPDMESIIFLAEEFRTTLTATALRYVKLSAEPCAIVVSQKRVIRWYQGSSDFDFHIKAGKEIDSDSYAFDLFKETKLSETSGTVPAYAWIDGSIDENAEIIESSFAIRRYNTVISLLWINKEIRYTYQKKDEEDNDNYDLTDLTRPDGKRRINGR